LSRRKPTLGCWTAIRVLDLGRARSLDPMPPITITAADGNIHNLHWADEGGPIGNGSSQPVVQQSVADALGPPQDPYVGTRGRGLGEMQG
jgi:hypothetical protein